MRHVWVEQRSPGPRARTFQIESAKRNDALRRTSSIVMGGVPRSLDTFWSALGQVTSPHPFLGSHQPALTELRCVLLVRRVVDSVVRAGLQYALQTRAPSFSLRHTLTRQAPPYRLVLQHGGWPLTRQGAQPLLLGMAQYHPDPWFGKMSVRRSVLRRGSRCARHMLPPSAFHRGKGTKRRRQRPSLHLASLGGRHGRRRHNVTRRAAPNAMVNAHRLSKRARRGQGQGLSLQRLAPRYRTGAGPKHLGTREKQSRKRRRAGSESRGPSDLR